MVIRTLKIVCVLFVLCLPLATGCINSFKEIEANELEKLWIDSKNHSAVSWWYLGEKEGFYYVVEKWPLRSNRYKVSKAAVTINREAPLTFSFDEKKWINLKAGDLIFNKNLPQDHGSR